MQQLESDLDQTQEKLMTANQRLEEKEKALQNAEGLCLKLSFFRRPSQLRWGASNSLNVQEGGGRRN